jgi:PAS domain S-box-containing protein
MDEAASTPTGFRYRKLLDCLSVVLLFALILACVIFTGDANSPVRVLLVIPVIIIATAWGRRWGAVAAVVAGVYLLLVSLLTFHDSSNQLFQLNAVYTGVMVLVAWLVGGVTDREKEARWNLIEINQSLERVIAERTRELVLSNHDLSAKINERRWAKDQLMKCEARFQSLLVNASVGVALIDCGANFLTANEAFCSFLGYPSQEILHKKLGQFVPLEENSQEKTLNDKLTGECQTCMLEQRFVRKDGEVVWGRLNVSLVRDDQEACEHRIIVCEDVTSLKTKESELQALGRIYEAMHNAMRDIFKPSGQLITEPRPEADASWARHKGAGEPGAASYEEAVAAQVLEIAREITGAAWVEYHSYDADSRMLCLVSSAGMPQELFLQARAKFRYSLNEERGIAKLAARERKSLYLPNVGANPGWVRLESSIQSCYVVPIHYGDTLFGVYELLSKQVNGFSGQQRAMADTLALYISTAMENARLFSEVQRAFERINSIQQQLLQSQKMEAIGQLAGGIAHDLNNQLTVIQASVDLNMGLATENPSFSKAFRRIRHATERSANLIRQLLLFGRKHPQFKVLLDLNDDIRELQEMLQRLIGDDVAICLDLTPDLWTVYADATNIEQVVINMAINSRDAMEGGGMIAIKTENVVFGQATVPVRGYAGSFVCLSVSDTGMGIESQYLLHIFEPFFTTKEAGKGTGLGLSVAYGIVEAHRGWIDVESMPGAGSTFRVYLPAQFLAEEPDDEDEPIAPSCLQGSGENILLVEDDPDLAGLTVSLLAENGYAVWLYGTVTEACQAFGQPGASWDLLLSDAVLPDGQGSELIRRLRLQQPFLEAILFSGYADERASLDQIQQEELFFLRKPYTGAELLSKVREAMKRRVVKE